MSKSKYNVTNAPRHVRMKWLKKAQAARKYYSRCRKRMGSWLAPKASPIFHPTPPVARSIDETEDWVPHSNPDLHLLNKDDAGDYRVQIRSGGKLAVPGEDGYFTPDFDDAWMTSKHMLSTRSDLRDKRAKWARTKAAKMGMSNNPGRLLDQVRPGSTVTVVNRFGQLRKGRAVMRSSSGGWVLNMGGRYGTPEIADDKNITKVSGGRRAQARNPELLVVSNPGNRRNASMRRRRRNSWHGNRKGHRKAALKGWRKRRHSRKGSRRSTRRKGRKSRGRRSKHFRTYRAACKALGIGKAAARAWKKSKYNKK